MTFLNDRPTPSRAPGCAGKLLLLALFGALAFVVVGNKLIPAAAIVSSITPASITPTSRPIAPELSNLAITQAALDMEGTQLAYHGTALANEAIAAQVTQQAAIFRTQLAREAVHAAMTETTEAQQSNRRAAWINETETILQSNAQMKAQATATAAAWQATAAVVTRTAVAGEWQIAENKRATAVRLAGVETVLWRIVIPLTVAGVVVMIGRAFAVMLTRRYGAPQEVQPEPYQPDEIAPDDDPLQTVPFTKVLVPSQTGDSGRWVVVQVWPEKLAAFARGIGGRATEAERFWTGSNGIFSQSEYDLMRDSMITVGLGHWINLVYPRQGWSLSAEGRAALGLIARPTTAPLTSSSGQML